MNFNYTIDGMDIVLDIDKADIRRIAIKTILTHGHLTLEDATAFIKVCEAIDLDISEIFYEEIKDAYLDEAIDLAEEQAEEAERERSELENDYRKSVL